MTGNDIDERIKKHFATFDRAEFAGWLKKGLRDSYSPSRDSENPHPFDPVYPEIVYQDMVGDYVTVPDFLGRVYDKFFSDSGKQMFRGAIGDVLSSQINQTELTAEAFKDLIYLIPTVSAEESLDSLVSFEGETKSGKGDLYATLAVLRHFKPSKTVYEATERLADSSNFDEGYLFEVIGILVENQPFNTGNILRRFEPRIEKLRNSIPDDVKEREAFSRAKRDCFRRVSGITDVVQYGGTWLTQDYGPLKVK